MSTNPEPEGGPEEATPSSNPEPQTKGFKRAAKVFQAAAKLHKAQQDGNIFEQNIAKKALQERTRRFQLKRVIDHITEESVSQKWNDQANQFLANHKLTVRKFFQRFDRDGDGFLTTAEVIDALKNFKEINLTEKEIKMLVSSWDDDNSKTVDYKEFTSGLKYEHRKMQTTKTTHRAKKIDIPGAPKPDVDVKYGRGQIKRNNLSIQDQHLKFGRSRSAGTSPDPRPSQPKKKPTKKSKEAETTTNSKPAKQPKQLKRSKSSSAVVTSPTKPRRKSSDAGKSKTTPSQKPVSKSRRGSTSDIKSSQPNRSTSPYSRQSSGTSEKQVQEEIVLPKEPTKAPDEMILRSSQDAGMQTQSVLMLDQSIQSEVEMKPCSQSSTQTDDVTVRHFGAQALIEIPQRHVSLQANTEAPKPTVIDSYAQTDAVVQTRMRDSSVQASPVPVMIQDISIQVSPAPKQQRHVSLQSNIPELKPAQRNVALQIEVAPQKPAQRHVRLQTDTAPKPFLTTTFPVCIDILPLIEASHEIEAQDKHQVIGEIECVDDIIEIKSKPPSEIILDDSYHAPKSQIIPELDIESSNQDLGTNSEQFHPSRSRPTIVQSQHQPVDLNRPKIAHGYDEISIDKAVPETVLGQEQSTTEPSLKASKLNIDDDFSGLGSPHVPNHFSKTFNDYDGDSTDYKSISSDRDVQSSNSTLIPEIVVDQNDKLGYSSSSKYESESSKYDHAYQEPPSLDYNRRSLHDDSHHLLKSTTTTAFYAPLTPPRSPQPTDSKDDAHNDFGVQRTNKGLNSSYDSRWRSHYEKEDIRDPSTRHRSYLSTRESYTIYPSNRDVRRSWSSSNENDQDRVMVMSSRPSRDVHIHDVRRSWHHGKPTQNIYKSTTIRKRQGSGSNLILKQQESYSTILSSGVVEETDA